MTLTSLFLLASAVLPAALMLLATSLWRTADVPSARQRLRRLALAALAGTAISLGLQLLVGSDATQASWAGLTTTLAAAWVALLVQWLGTVIAAYASRYLEGEPGQTRFIAAFGAVLAGVHLMLLADHWLVLIAAWAAVGVALERLLCFYADRPFALLAAHKKRLADRAADLLLIVAAALAWSVTGSGSLSALWLHLESGAPSVALQASAVLLALAVVLRTALLPVHGWLIQVMEAPTPVSALLHAGVINLGAVVLIRFAPLLDQAPVARWLLVAFGLASALLAGLVMLTRISIKVRLAWSTVAQMGFMVMECGLGLYTLALLHLVGHSLYKAHAFLTASRAVEETRLQMMRNAGSVSVASVLAAPLLTAGWLAGLLVLVTTLVPGSPWPWWWTAVLALAWAPMLWRAKTPGGDVAGTVRSLLTGLGLVTGMTLAAWLGHALPLGTVDSPDGVAGLVALVGMTALYVCLAMLQVRPEALSTWRRWSHAGFYIDEHVTRAALRAWPARWTPATKT
ncbi:NADH-quinone oxidoreductase subunit L [Leptothrix sp. BB-4]